MMLLKNPFALLNEECYPLLDIITNIKNKFKTANGGKRMTQTPTSHGDTARINQTIRRRMLDILKRISDAADSRKITSTGTRLPSYCVNSLRISINSILLGIRKRYFADLNVLDGHVDGLAWNSEENGMSDFFNDLMTRAGLHHLLSDSEFLQVFQCLYAVRYTGKDPAFFLEACPQAIKTLLKGDKEYREIIRLCIAKDFSKEEYLKVLDSLIIITQLLRKSFGLECTAFSALSSRPYNFPARLEALHLLALIRSYGDDENHAGERQVVKEASSKTSVERKAEIVGYLMKIEKLNEHPQDLDIVMACAVFHRVLETENYELVSTVKKFFDLRSIDGFYRDLRMQWEELLGKGVLHGGCECTELPMQVKVAVSPHDREGNISSKVVSISKAFRYYVERGIVTVECNEPFSEAAQIVVTLKIGQAALQLWNRG